MADIKQNPFRKAHKPSDKKAKIYHPCAAEREFKDSAYAKAIRHLGSGASVEEVVKYLRERYGYYTQTFKFESMREYQ